MVPFLGHFVRHTRQEKYEYFSVKYQQKTAFVI